MAVTLAAPPTVLFAKVRDTTPQPRLHVALSDNHAYASLVGGGGWAAPGKGWTHSENVEVLRGRVYAELSIESFRFSDLGSVQFQTLREGYLISTSRLLGGVTLGYRVADGDAVQNAVEIGLPLMFGSPRGRVRLEPTYVLSSAGVTWNYRFQGDFPIAHTPMFLGLNVEAKTLRQGGKYFGTPGLVIGARF